MKGFRAYGSPPWCSHERITVDVDTSADVCTAIPVCADCDEHLGAGVPIIELIGRAIRRAADSTE